MSIRSTTQSATVSDYTLTDRPSSDEEPPAKRGATSASAQGEDSQSRSNVVHLAQLQWGCAEPSAPQRVIMDTSTTLFNRMTLVMLTSGDLTLPTALARAIELTKKIVLNPSRACFQATVESQHNTLKAMIAYDLGMWATEGKPEEKRMIAKAKIEQFMLDPHATLLSLADLKLTSLPKSLFTFAAFDRLQKLDLSGNEMPLSEFQTAFVWTTNLRELSLSNCNLEKIPILGATLPLLEKLVLINNPKIKELPPILLQLQKLKMVIVDNGIETIPEGMETKVVIAHSAHVSS